MDDCAICYEPVTATTGHCTLGCTHTFHINCLTKWTDKTASCPMCRRTLTETETPQKTQRAPTLFDLANGVIPESDILIVMHQADVPRSRAEELLRENDGDIVNSILQIINAAPEPVRDPLTTPTHEQTMAWMFHRIANPQESRYKWGSYSDMVLRTRRGIHCQHQQWYNREFSDIESQRGYDSS